MLAFKFDDFQTLGRRLGFPVSVSCLSTPQRTVILHNCLIKNQLVLYTRSLARLILYLQFLMILERLKGVPNLCLVLEAQIPNGDDTGHSRHFWLSCGESTQNGTGLQNVGSIQNLTATHHLHAYNVPTNSCCKVPLTRSGEPTRSLQTTERMQYPCQQSDNNVNHVQNCHTVACCSLHEAVAAGLGRESHARWGAFAETPRRLREKGGPAA